MSERQQAGIGPEGCPAIVGLALGRNPLCKGSHPLANSTVTGAPPHAGDPASRRQCVAWVRLVARAALCRRRCPANFSPNVLSCVPSRWMSTTAVLAACTRTVFVPRRPSVRGW